MTEPDDAAKPVRLTARGAATRDRIVRAAADLMYMRGVNATTFEDVLTASGASKSQLYRHFGDKEALVRAVIEVQAEQMFDRQRRRLDRLDSIRGLELWRDAVVQRHALRDGLYGCELGSLAAELADQDDQARQILSGHFQAWEALLAAGFARMVELRALRDDADPQRLAVGVMAALQGGYLLAQMVRDVAPMRIALDMAIDHVKSYAL